jgi:hypothetical protein
LTIVELSGTATATTGASGALGLGLGLSGTATATTGATAALYVLASDVFWGFVVSYAARGGVGSPDNHGYASSPDAGGDVGGPGNGLGYVYKYGATGTVATAGDDLRRLND